MPLETQTSASFVVLLSLSKALGEQNIQRFLRKGGAHTHGQGNTSTQACKGGSASIDVALAWLELFQACSRDFIILSVVHCLLDQAGLPTHNHLLNTTLMTLLTMGFQLPLCECAFM